MFTKLLVANRGEIACRVMRTAVRMGIRTVAVFSEADAQAMHVHMADEAVAIGAAPPRESYLHIERIIETARATGAEAIHPGYGFLSENPSFVEACNAAGIAFVGPPATAMRAMGSKAGAKRLMEAAGVPLVPGYHGAGQDAALLAAEAERIGFPVLIKASAGGGGRGMRMVERPGDFSASLAAARREAEAAFGDSRILLEKYLARPRHIEVQILADRYGRTVHLGTRDCSIQRRHQKILEEAPAPGICEATHEMFHAAAITAAEACGYVNAGTVEFIAEGSGADPAFYFMEMNTRLQVEHPVTEEVYGIDLVEAQLRIAAGERLPAGHDALVPRGHAIEVRLCAEDPAQEFRPATGRIAALRLPGDHARVDSGVRAGDSVTPDYDSMLAKIIAYGTDRAECCIRLAQALSRTAVLGPATNLELLRRIVCHEDFKRAVLDTGFIGHHADALLPPPAPVPFSAALAADARARIGHRSQHVANRIGHITGKQLWVEYDSPWEQLYGFRLYGAARETTLFQAEGGQVAVVREIHADGRQGVRLPDGTLADCLGAGGDEAPLRIVLTRPPPHVPERITAEVLRDRDLFQVTLEGDPHPYALRLIDPYVPSGADATGPDRIAAPIPGLVARVTVAAGDTVTRGQVLAVLEAMKTEIRITAPSNGTITRLLVQPGDQVQEGMELVVLASDGKQADG